MCNLFSVTRSLYTSVTNYFSTSASRLALLFVASVLILSCSSGSGSSSGGGGGAGGVLIADWTFRPADSTVTAFRNQGLGATVIGRLVFSEDEIKRLAGRELNTPIMDVANLVRGTDYTLSFGLTADSPAQARSFFRVDNIPSGSTMVEIRPQVDEAVIKSDAEANALGGLYNIFKQVNSFGVEVRISFPNNSDKQPVSLRTSVRFMEEGAQPFNLERAINFSPSAGISQPSPQAGQVVPVSLQTRLSGIIPANTLVINITEADYPFSFSSNWNRGTVTHLGCSFNGAACPAGGQLSGNQAPFSLADVVGVEDSLCTFAGGCLKHGLSVQLSRTNSNGTAIGTPVTVALADNLDFNTVDANFSASGSFLQLLQAALSITDIANIPANNAFLTNDASSTEVRFKTNVAWSFEYHRFGRYTPAVPASSSTVFSTRKELYLGENNALGDILTGGELLSLFGVSIRGGDRSLFYGLTNPTAVASHCATTDVYIDPVSRVLKAVAGMLDFENPTGIFDSASTPNHCRIAVSTDGSNYEFLGLAVNTNTLDANLATAVTTAATNNPALVASSNADVVGCDSVFNTTTNNPLSQNHLCFYAEVAPRLIDINEAPQFSIMHGPAAANELGGIKESVGALARYPTAVTFSSPSLLPNNVLSSGNVELLQEAGTTVEIMITDEDLYPGSTTVHQSIDPASVRIVSVTPAHGNDIFSVRQIPASTQDATPATFTLAVDTSKLDFERFAAAELTNDRALYKIKLSASDLNGMTGMSDELLFEVENVYYTPLYVDPASPTTVIDSFPAAFKRNERLEYDITREIIYLLPGVATFLNPGLDVLGNYALVNPETGDETDLVYKISVSSGVLPHTGFTLTADNLFELRDNPAGVGRILALTRNAVHLGNSGTTTPIPISVGVEYVSNSDVAESKNLEIIVDENEYDADDGFRKITSTTFKNTLVNAAVTERSDREFVTFTDLSVSPPTTSTDLSFNLASGVTSSDARFGFLNDSSSLLTSNLAIPGIGIIGAGRDNFFVDEGRGSIRALNANLQAPQRFLLPVYSRPSADFPRASVAEQENNLVIVDLLVQDENQAPQVSRANSRYLSGGPVSANGAVQSVRLALPENIDDLSAESEIARFAFTDDHERESSHITAVIEATTMASSTTYLPMTDYFNISVAETATPGSFEAVVRLAPDAKFSVLAQDVRDDIERHFSATIATAVSRLSNPPRVTASDFDLSTARITLTDRGGVTYNHNSNTPTSTRTNPATTVVNTTISLTDVATGRPDLQLMDGNDPYVASYSVNSCASTADTVCVFTIAEDAAVNDILELQVELANPNDLAYRLSGARHPQSSADYPYLVESATPANPFTIVFEGRDAGMVNSAFEFIPYARKSSATAGVTRTEALSIALRVKDSDALDNLGDGVTFPGQLRISGPGGSDIVEIGLFIEDVDRAPDLSFITSSVALMSELEVAGGQRPLLNSANLEDFVIKQTDISADADERRPGAPNYKAEFELNITSQTLTRAANLRPVPTNTLVFAREQRGRDFVFRVVNPDYINQALFGDVELALIARDKISGRTSTATLTVRVTSPAGEQVVSAQRLGGVRKASATYGAIYEQGAYVTGVPTPVNISTAPTVTIANPVAGLNPRPIARGAGPFTFEPILAAGGGVEQDDLLLFDYAYNGRRSIILPFTASTPRLARNYNILRQDADGNLVDALAEFNRYFTLETARNSAGHSYLNITQKTYDFINATNHRVANGYNALDTLVLYQDPANTAEEQEFVYYIRAYTEAAGTDPAKNALVQFSVTAQETGGTRHNGAAATLAAPTTQSAREGGGGQGVSSPIGIVINDTDNTPTPNFTPYGAVLLVKPDFLDDPRLSSDSYEHNHFV